MSIKLVSLKRRSIYDIPACEDNDYWKTPPWLWKYVQYRFGAYGAINDPCPVDPIENGILVPWGKNNYVNPPYSQSLQWIIKGMGEASKGKNNIFLLPVDTSTKLWGTYIYSTAYQIIFFQGRIKFVGAKGSPRFASALIHMKANCLQNSSPIYDSVLTEDLICRFG